MSQEHLGIFKERNPGGPNTCWAYVAWSFGAGASPWLFHFEYCFDILYVEVLVLHDFPPSQAISNQVIYIKNFVCPSREYSYHRQFLLLILVAMVSSRMPVSGAESVILQSANQFKDTSLLVHTQDRYKCSQVVERKSWIFRCHHGQTPLSGQLPIHSSKPLPEQHRGKI